MKLLGVNIVKLDGWFSQFKFDSKYQELNDYFVFNMYCDIVKYVWITTDLFTDVAIKSQNEKVILEILYDNIDNKIVKKQFEELFKKELIFL